MKRSCACGRREAAFCRRSEALNSTRNTGNRRLGG
jgi:hypothetical protein